MQAHAAAMRAAIEGAGRGLVERSVLVEALALAAVAGEHLLVIGPPGTAKSEAVRRLAHALGGNYFEYLLGRFTEPSEIFGPVDLRKLRDGVVETATSGMLPEAEIAFLDEIFQGSTAILNTLLGILNERVFRRGHSTLRVPLRLCVAASNGLPEDPALAAFADRFLLRLFVDPVPDPRLEELLEQGWALANAPAPAGEGWTHLDALARAAREADLGPVRPFLADALRELRAAGIALSDRRAVKVQKLVAAAAVLDGRGQPGIGDLWPLIYAVPTPEQQSLAREVMRETLAAAHNASRPAAAEEASQGPLARAARLIATGRELLEAPGERDHAWRLKLEGVAREIDAGFAPEALPEELGTVRENIVSALQSSG
jgi:MoxR-like ATPase